MSHPVLFLPGTLCDERVWLPVWRHLNISQRRYAPLQWATRFEDMLALTGDRVLEGEQVHIVGFSMGGYIGAHWAVNHPDQVASLTLLNYSPFGLTKEETARRKQLIAVLQKGQFLPDSPNYIKRFVYTNKQDDDNVAGVVKAMGQDLGAATLLAHTQATTPRPSMIDNLAGANFPIHILAADADEVVDINEVINAAKAVNAASCTVVEQAGHMSVLEQPEYIAKELQPLFSG